MSLRVAILTGTDIRHRYFVNAVRAEFHVVFAGYESTGYVPADAAKDEVDEATAAIVQHHFAERERQEWAYFGHDAAALVNGAGVSVVALDPRGLNTAATANAIEVAGADVVLIYGTNLIKPPLLDRFAGRMINMHLGLSPYYRGTATNFYPLLNDEPQYVGVTVHMIDPGIDSGDIIHQARPDITADDKPHTVGCKAILAGIEQVLRALREFEAGSLQSTPQWDAPNARLYRRRDYHPSQVTQLYRLIADGLFPRYAERQHELRDAVRLVP